MKKVCIFVVSVFAVYSMFPAYATTDIAADAESSECTENITGTYSGDANFKAKWTPNNIQLNWHDGYSGTQIIPANTSANTCNYGGALTIPNNPPERIGYIFDGWTVVLPYTPINGTTNAASTIVYTGINSGSTNMEFEIRVKPSLGSFYIFQSRNSSNTITICGLSGSTYGETINFSCGNNRSPTSSIVRNINHVYYIKGSINNTTMTLYVKDETTGEEDTKVATAESITTLPIAEICLYGNTTGNRINAGNTIYMAKLRIDGDLVMDYIPAIQGTTVGFYDKISKTFKSASAGSLSAEN